MPVQDTVLRDEFGGGACSAAEEEDRVGSERDDEGDFDGDVANVLSPPADGSERGKKEYNALKDTFSGAAEVLQMVKERERLAKEKELLDQQLAELNRRVLAKSRKVGASIPSAREMCAKELSTIPAEERALFTDDKFEQDLLKERKLEEEWNTCRARVKRAREELMEHRATMEKQKRFRALETHMQQLDEFVRQHEQLVDVGGSADLGVPLEAPKPPAKGVSRGVRRVGGKGP